MDRYLQHAAALNVKFANAQVAELTAEQMVAQPSPNATMNHPAWVLGHLCVYNSVSSKLLGGEALCPEAWETTFGMGSTPQPSADAYPSKQTLLDTFASSTTSAMDALLSASEDALQQPAPEVMRDFFPTVGDYVLYDLTAHVGFHLGQLSAWRRAMGLPSLF
ncbi:DinB family protein [Phycisphaerales bacterium AB-hyl4]|uniref:DinB family protein n=1 Tax=Natronomicrosphaera hydrolytica TaxID=3242702 RepID=A0ABV4U4A8_9BACT